MSWEAGSPVLSGLMIQHIWNYVTEYKLIMLIPTSQVFLFIMTVTLFKVMQFKEIEVPM